jgi:hypothetical protein
MISEEFCNMKKNRITQVLAGVAIMAALLLTAACSSDDSTSTTPEPKPDTPEVDPMEQRIKECLEPGNEARPSWTMDNSLYELYEQTMAVKVVPQKFLQDYISDDDLLCATIGNQVRAVSNAKKTNGKYYFALIVAGNGNEGNVTINYYCSRLKRMYIAKDWVEFNTDLTPSFLGDPFEVVFYEDIDKWQSMQNSEY